MNNVDKKQFDYYLKDEDLEKLLTKTPPPAYYDILCIVIDEYKLLRGKYVALQVRLAERVSVEKAKDIIMEKFNCSGDEAMKYMQKLCSSKNIRIGQAAEMIIAVREAL